MFFPTEKSGRPMSRLLRRGAFIAFEGIDGSGKTTQVRRFAQKLRERQIPVRTTAEPTTGPIGAMIRQSFSGRTEFDDRVIAALFVADRLDHLTNKFDGVFKLVNDGQTVVTDRYYLSSYAYHASEVDIDWIAAANSINTNIIRPDLTIFIDIEPAVALQRITENRLIADRFEVLPRLEAARENYFHAFDLVKGTENIVIVSGEQGEDELADIIWKEAEATMENFNW